MIVKYGVLANGILVVAIAGIILIAYLVVVGSETGCGCEELTFQIGSPEVSIRLSGEEVIWDGTLIINKVTPRDEKVDWTEVRVVVKSSDGSILNIASQPQPYDPSAITDGGISGTDVQFWFEDNDGDGKVDAGDIILVTGMNDDQYEGALVLMMKGGKIIGDTMLPTDFP